VVREADTKQINTGITMYVINTVEANIRINYRFKM
jgi:hypothetical protein